MSNSKRSLLKPKTTSVLLHTRALADNKKHHISHKKRSVKKKKKRRPHVSFDSEPHRMRLLLIFVSMQQQCCSR